MTLSSGWKGTKELLEMRSWEPEPAYFGKEEGAVTPTNAIWWRSDENCSHDAPEKDSKPVLVRKFARFLEKYKAMYGEMTLKILGVGAEFLGARF